MPSLNFTPLMISESNLKPRSLRELTSVVRISLQAIASVVFWLPQFLVLFVLSLTVANIDSMGFVVRICVQCLGVEIVKYQHFHFVFSQGLRYFGIFSTVSYFELSEGFLCLLLCLRHPDIAKRFFHSWLNRFLDFV